ncbi:hypothetical protein [Chryseobacterium sp.]|uniref:hypothetical protein n=1 Tax=Chryseobacterium sp. TaxID=1871047 RepID=UPI00289BD84C|nr:hypothetical protein [Chryseobacterium sp.]
MRKAFLSFLVLLCIYCSKGGEQQKDVDWVILNDKNKIPEQIKDFFLASEKSELKIANPNEAFNIGDAVLDRDLPFRQLKLLEKKNDVWRLVYFQGGIGTSYQFYEFKIAGDTISSIRKGYSFENIESNDSLEYYIKRGKVKFDSVKIRYELEN